MLAGLLAVEVEQPAGAGGQSGGAGEGERCCKQGRRPRQQAAAAETGNPWAGAGGGGTRGGRGYNKGATHGWPTPWKVVSPTFSPSAEVGRANDHTHSSLHTFEYSRCERVVNLAAPARHPTHSGMQ